MNPNPKSFPILSYVMSRLHPNPVLFRSLEPDIEQPPVSDPPPRSDEVELVERMPHLDRPDLLASMATAVSEVAQTRAVLNALGDRPDHEAVDAARSGIAEIESALARRLEEIVRAPRPEDVDRVQWRAEQAELEGRCRAEAEREMNACKAVIQLDDMHEAYGRLLRDAEDRLVKMYGSVEESSDGCERGEEGDGEQVNEEVVGILQEASGKFLERVELSDRQLKSIPEAFGQMRGMISLNLSNNLLEAIPDSIGGLEHLEELRVSSNLLISLPDSIGLLLNLKILDVSGNQLKALPDSIARCRSLVELDASYNSLTYLPTNIGYELVNLQELRIHLNKIRSLPTSICEMRSLRLLDAHFNELRGLPYAIGNLTNLEVLNLSSNFSDLKVLPDSIGDLANLRELDLSNNQIHTLPDSFGRLERLAKLSLDQNPMVVPPAVVVNEGVEAVREFMANIMLSRVLEEQKIMDENPAPATGWLTRSTSWLSSFVPGSVAGYIGAGQKSPRDPLLDQQM